MQKFVKRQFNSDPLPPHVLTESASSEIWGTISSYHGCPWRLVLKFSQQHRFCQNCFTGERENKLSLPFQTGTGSLPGVGPHANHIFQHQSFCCATKSQWPIFAKMPALYFQNQQWRNSVALDQFFWGSPKLKEEQITLSMPFLWDKEGSVFPTATISDKSYTLYAYSHNKHI